MAVVSGITTTAFSQYYYIPHTNNPGNPGGLCTDAEYPVAGGQIAGWTSINAGSNTSPVWTAQQSIPFTFNFNGSTVTNYYASTSGVVTFGSTGTVPPTANAALPSASIPDNSVMVWGLEGSGTNDNICYKTFGSAPNRQYWIIYSSYTTPGQGDYQYWAIVLEETSNHIYIVDARASQTASDLTAGLQINSTTAFMVAGSPALASLSAGDPTPADNNYYEFVMGTLPANEIALTAVNPVAGSPAAFGLTNSNITLSGTVMNQGSSPITQFTAKYSDGTTTWSDVINCNISSMTSYTFNNPTQYLIASNGDHPLTYWVEMPNDNDMTNNNGATTISGVPFMPDHNVVFEEATGTWCGWCVRGIVFMDSMQAVHGNDVVLIAVHNGDPMVVTSYDAGVGTFISGFPSVLVDRKEVIDPSDMEAGYQAHINDFGFADLTITPSSNATAGTISADVSAHFAANLSGDYRLSMVVTEDDCHGTGSTWGQHNYYTNNAYGPMGGFENLPGTVPAADMYYDWVARSIAGGFTGQTGSLPATINAGDTHNFTFNYIIPSGENPSLMSVKALLINATTGEILNGTGAKIVTDVPTINGSNIDFNVYPNPATNMVIVSTDVNGSANTTVTITDLMGRTLQTIEAGNITSGSYNFNFDITTLSSGIYFANVMTEKGIVSKKFIKE